MSVLPNDRQDSKPLRRHPIHESQGIVRLIVTLSEYDLATEQRETALSSQAEIYIIGGLLRRDCPAEVCHCRIWTDGEPHDHLPTSPLLTLDQVARLFALVLWRTALRQAEALKLEGGI